MTREEHYKAAEAEMDEAETLYGNGDEELAVTRLRFAAVHAQLAQTPAFESTKRQVVYRDKDGDLWKDLGRGSVSLIEHLGEPQVGEPSQDKVSVEHRYGPLVPVPAPPKAGA